MTIALIIAAVLLVAFLGYAATRPEACRFQRSLAMQAPPEKLYDLLSDFHKWPSWSPWEKLDPAAKKTYSGALSGKGAAFSWAGNSKAGEGRAEIVEVAPPSRIVMNLDFLKPFEAHNRVEFRMEPRGDRTLVTWTMDGKHNYMMKVMSIFIDMDKMIGKDFEEGLRNMQSIVEKPAVVAQ